MPPPGAEPPDSPAPPGAFDGAASEWIAAAWPAPKSVRAGTTTRLGGCSSAPFEGLNLSFGVGDEADAVRRNRAHLASRLGLPEPPRWLRQVHGARVVDAGNAATGVAADACVARRPGPVCAILTADCLPVALCDRAGSCVAIAHAGWRGLAAGVLEATVGALARPPGEFLAWLGPGIGPGAYEVGEEVREVLVGGDPGARAAFAPSPRGRWLADLYALARRRLHRLGVFAVYGGDHCTFSDPHRFYSYRRDGRATGRMASLVWLQEDG